MKRSLPSLFLLSFCSLFLTAQPIAYPPAVLDSATALVQRFVDYNQIPGASVTVAVDGKIAWSQGFGYADLENQVPVKAGLTKFRIGSVSKPITAAALGVLYDEGKIDLDTPIQTYVPSFPEKRWPVTLRQLAGHLAGVRHYHDLEWMSARRYTTVEEGLTIFAADTLLFEPGERYSYSSYAWNLISAAIEGAAGGDFLTYMQHTVFDPLGMKNTTADYTDSLIAHRTRFYTKTSDGTIINAPFVDNSYKWAGGGFIATTDDLARFGSAHLASGLLSDTTLRLWLTPQATNDGKSTGYGIGWRADTDSHGHDFFGHSGGSVGGITQLVVYPESRVVVAMLTNSDRVDYGVVHHQLAHLFAPQPDDLSALFALMNGEFSSEEQATADSAFFHINLVMHPIWKSDPDVKWLYVEQAVASALDQPYRQRVYRLSPAGNGVIESRVYELPDPAKFIHGWDNPTVFAELTPETLLEREGCAVFLQKDADGCFSGATKADECSSSLRGASYATSEVQICPGQMISWDRGWNENGQQVWGSEKGGYVFRRKK